MRGLGALLALRLVGLGYFRNRIVVTPVRIRVGSGQPQQVTQYTRVQQRLITSVPSLAIYQPISSLRAIYTPGGPYIKCALGQRIQVYAFLKKSVLVMIYSNLGTIFRLVQGLGALLALRLVGLDYFRNNLSINKNNSYNPYQYSSYQPYFLIEYRYYLNQLSKRYLNLLIKKLLLLFYISI